jgi:hypothetical protein
MSLTPSQVREAVELGDESYDIGAAAKPQVAQVTVRFTPPFTSLDQFRQIVKKLTVDGGAIVSLNRNAAIVVATLEPGDLPALRPGRALFKIGASTVSVVSARAR